MKGVIQIPPTMIIVLVVGIIIAIILFGFIASQGPEGFTLEFFKRFVPEAFYRLFGPHIQLN